MERDGSAGLAYALPLLIVTVADARRVRRELDALDSYLESQKLREPGLPTQRLPKTSRMLDDLAASNKLNLLHPTVRRDLKQYLRSIVDHAPVVHISFASEPSSAALQKVLQWLRRNINDAVLIQVGLEPSIVAGCVLRTTNRSFDLSLGHYLDEQRHILLEALAAPAPAAPEQAAEATDG